jgi:hypothetical protein
MYMPTCVSLFVHAIFLTDMLVNSFGMPAIFLPLHVQLEYYKAI